MCTFFNEFICRVLRQHYSQLDQCTPVISSRCPSTLTLEIMNELIKIVQDETPPWNSCSRGTSKDQWMKLWSNERKIKESTSWYVGPVKDLAAEDEAVNHDISSISDISSINDIYRDGFTLDQSIRRHLHAVKVIVYQSGRWKNTKLKSSSIAIHNSTNHTLILEYFDVWFSSLFSFPYIVVDIRSVV